jgi:hypothetical protein
MKQVAQTREHWKIKDENKAVIEIPKAHHQQ